MQPLSSLGNGLFEGDTEFYLQVFFLFYFLSITSWSITWISLQFRYFSTLNREKQVNDHKLRFHFWPDSQTVLEQIQRNLLQWTLNLHKVEQTGWSCLSLWALLLSAGVHQPESWNYSWSLPNFSWPAWESVFLLSTGQSILGRTLFLRRRIPAETRAPRSPSMAALACVFLASKWMNSSIVRVLLTK